MRLSSIRQDGSGLYLLLAFLVSAILWYTVNAREQIERVIDVRLDYKGLPTGLVIVEGQLNKIEARLRGPRELFRTMEGREQSYTIDLSGVVKGMNVIPFDRVKEQEQGLLRTYQILDLNPQRLTLEVDTLAIKQVPVVMRPRNVADVEDVVIQWISVDPAKVIMSGPASVLAEIEQIEVDVSLGAFSEGMAHSASAPVISPGNIEVRPMTVSAEYVVTVNRTTVPLIRPLSVEGREHQCSADPARVRLRVAVPEHRAEDREYLERIMAVIDTDITMSPDGEYPIQVSLPRGARLESIAPAMGRALCE